MTTRILALLILVFSATAPSAMGGDWPGFRGPNGTGTIGAEFAPDGPVELRVAWKRELGPGYSSVIVADGRVIATFGAGAEDVMAAFDTESGDELWRYRIADAYKGHDGSHDGPLSTPLVADGRVYGVGALGHLFALEAKTGREVWASHMVDDLGGEAPFYGVTTSPIMASGALIVQLSTKEQEAGKAIAGIAADTGKLLWSVGTDEISFHSPVVADIAGREQVLAAGRSNFYGIDAKNGEVLWTYEHHGDERAMGGHTIVPLPVGDGRVFIMNQVESSAMLQITNDDGDYAVTELWTTKAIKRSYVQPVHHDGYLYGISGRTLTCIDVATGERVWRSRAPGDGFPIVVGNHLVVVTKPGSLHVAPVSSQGYEEIASLELFDAHSWSTPAYADGHLYTRSMSELARVDVVSAAPVADAGDPVGSDAAGTDDVATPTVIAADARLLGAGFGELLASLDGADDKQNRVNAFIAASTSFPIIESNGTVHFVYQGEAEDVGMVGDVVGYRREDPMTRIEGTNLFYYSTRLEPDAAATYGFLVDYAEQAIADPNNPRPGKGLFGDVSWFAMPAWRVPDYLDAADEVNRGQLQEVSWESEALEGTRANVKVYLPVGYEDSEARYPVAYVHGGKDALEQGSMNNALDNLIGRGEVTPLIAVFLLPPDGEPKRGPEAAKAAERSLLEELIPKIDGDYRTLASPAARASIGAGRDGNAALLLALDHPKVFGRIGTQGARFLSNEPIESRLKSVSETPYVVYLEWGTYHLRSPHEAWDMARSSREAWQMFRDKGYRPAGGEVPEGYGWACWRGHTDAMLRSLFASLRG